MIMIVMHTYIIYIFTTVIHIHYYACSACDGSMQEDISIATDGVPEERWLLHWGLVVVFEFSLSLTPRNISKDCWCRETPEPEIHVQIAGAATTRIKLVFNELNCILFLPMFYFVLPQGSTNVLMQFAQAACFPCHAHFLLYEVFEAHFWQSVDKYRLQMSEVEQASKNSHTSLSSFATRSWNARRERFAELHSTPTCPQWWRFCYGASWLSPLYQGVLEKPALSSNNLKHPNHFEWNDTYRIHKQQPNNNPKNIFKKRHPNISPIYQGLMIFLLPLLFGMPTTILDIRRTLGQDGRVRVQSSSASDTNQPYSAQSNTCQLGSSYKKTIGKTIDIYIIYIDIYNYIYIWFIWYIYIYYKILENKIHF